MVITQISEIFGAKMTNKTLKAKANPYMPFTAV
jgi:hypothetical protein